MLIYSKIEKVRNSRNIPKMEFYQRIGITEPGYKKMVASNSLKLSTLEKISEVLGVKMSYWFENEENTTVVNDPAAEYGTGIEKKYIELLEKYNNLLENKLKSKP